MLEKRTTVRQDPENSNIEMVFIDLSIRWLGRHGRAGIMYRCLKRVDVSDLVTGPA